MLVALTQTRKAILERPLEATSSKQGEGICLESLLQSFAHNGQSYQVAHC